MARFKVTVVCDEYFVADSLRDLATAYEDVLEVGKYEDDHYEAIIEEV